jgi:hypothetical protein
MKKTVEDQLAEALGVLLLTDTTRDYLDKNDPMAVSQAQAALRSYGRKTGRWAQNSRQNPEHPWARNNGLLMTA